MDIAVRLLDSFIAALPFMLVTSAGAGLAYFKGIRKRFGDLEDQMTNNANATRDKLDQVSRRQALADQSLTDLGQLTSRLTTQDNALALLIREVMPAGRPSLRDLIDSMDDKVGDLRTEHRVLIAQLQSHYSQSDIRDRRLDRLERHDPS